MQPFRVELTVPRTPDEVHGYLVDLGHHPEWRFDVASSVLAGGLTGGVGARYAQHPPAELRAPECADVEAELVESQRPELVVFRVVEGRWTLEVTHLVAPDPDGSRVELVVGLERRGPRWWPAGSPGAGAEERAVRYGRGIALALGGALV